MRRWPYTFGVCLSIVVGRHRDRRLAAPRRAVARPGRLPRSGVRPPPADRPDVLRGRHHPRSDPPRMARRHRRRRQRVPRRSFATDWSFKRVGYIATGLVTFYVCYVSYRNLKSDLPLIRKGVLFDTDMLRFDHYLFFGHNPAEVLHDLLGTDILRAGARHGLCRLPPAHPPHPRRVPRVGQGPVARRLVRHRAQPQLGARSRQLLLAADPRPGVRPVVDVPGSPGHRCHRAPTRRCSGPVQASRKTRAAAPPTASPASRRCTCRWS